MNGRLYDAQLGRFLSPDNYVQDPYNTQSFNRYGYVWNNPLVAADPSGEIFKWLWKQVKGASRIVWNAVKITAGLFVTGPGSFWEKSWEIISRFTWQLPQTLIGFASAQATNLVGNVQSVDYFHGATVVRTYTKDWGAIAQGSFIIGDNSIRANPNNSLFQHEYGHYLQSQRMGWAYYPRVGIPSLISAKNSKGGEHKFHPVEQDANREAFLYFNRNVKDFQDDASFHDAKGWNFARNPLDVYNTNSWNYIDYGNPEDLKLLDSLALKANWYDYVSWIFPVPVLSAVVRGVDNIYKRGNIKKL